MEKKEVKKMEKEVNLATYVPDFLMENDRNYVDVNAETSVGNQSSWVIKNIRISANNNVVMDVGETEMIVLEGASEMVEIPHGRRFANAAYRVLKSMGESPYKVDGTPWSFGAVLVDLNAWINRGNTLILVVKHDETKGRGFNLEAVKAE